jgi:hypothetical protein
MRGSQTNVYDRAVFRERYADFCWLFCDFAAGVAFAFVRRGFSKRGDLMLLNRLLPAAGVLASLVAAPSLAGATPITWGAATNISGDADVSTSGALVGAFNIGGQGVAATTVNGVVFSPFVLSGLSSTTGNFTFANAAGFGANNSTGGAGAPFTSLSAGYQALLSSVAGDFGTPSILTISGLTAGNTYQFQWWTSSSNVTGESTTATNVNSVSLSSNTGVAGTGVGQFALGTFVADVSGIETIAFTETAGSPDDFLNGFQLRAVAAPAAVPEPATMLLFGSGIAMVARRVRRQRRSNS